MTSSRPMPDPKAPKAWMLEGKSLADIRIMQDETCADLDAILAEFEKLETVGDVYRRCFFFLGSLDGTASSGLLGPMAEEYRKKLKAAESKAKRRITKALGIEPPSRLPTMKEWSSLGGYEAPLTVKRRLKS